MNPTVTWGREIDLGDAARLPAHDVRRAFAAPPVFRIWNELAVLTSPDILVAASLARLVGTDDPKVLLGVAFAIRAVRLGHVCVDLSSIATSASSDLDPGTDLSGLPWPTPTEWVASLTAAPLVACGDGEPPGVPSRPLRLVGNRLYLDRYWRHERQVAAELTARAASPIDIRDRDALRGGLDRLFPLGRSSAERSRIAAAAVVASRLSVIAGGPGTGKTTTVARAVALLYEQATASGGRPPRVALAAPTGKAAARLGEAVHHEAVHLDVDEPTRDWMLELEASTLHRLLGWRPDSASRFHHDRTNRLPHDAVIVDETSMLSLSLMAKLIDAVRADARLILVGDPQQLASIEAGAVLGDVVGPVGTGMRMTARSRQRLGSLTGTPIPATDPPGIDPPDSDPPGTDPTASHPLPEHTVGDGIVLLERVHRFGGGIAELAAAIVGGDGEGVTGLLRDGRADLRWFASGNLTAVRADVVRTGTALIEAAAGERAADALVALGALRVLCAHRQGPEGVAAWNDRIAHWLAAAVPGYGAAGQWYPGRPLLVTKNDYELQLFNGDTGVVIAGADGSPVAVFERPAGLRLVSPARLGSVESLHAMTIHKSQGSQFDEVVVILPDADGPIMTRELLYTAVTRARLRVTVVGKESVLRGAVCRPIARASGLRERLWGA
ncbi:MAG: exodeoxyribonuclease V subunit alpha [Acidimicrobiales bacterium]